MLKTSDRLLHVPASPIRKLVPYALEAKKKGVNVLHLNIGDPDIATPGEMIEVLNNWKDNPIAYGQSQGQIKFIEAVREYYRGIGFTFIDVSDIQVTTGGSEAISMALFACCNPGDEVIVFEPFYANYNSYAVINGVKIVPILTTTASGFHLPDRKIIEAKITPKTKAILYCNPNNPTGTVYTHEEIRLLVDLAKKHGLYLLADEVYREFVYDGTKQTSLFKFFKDIPEQAIVLDSLSKRYSLCGARLGMLVSKNKEIMAGVLRIAQGRLSSGYVDQEMASALTKVPKSYFKQVNSEYANRRDVLYQGLRSIPGVTIPKPEGAFYAIVGLPVSKAEKFCKWLLTDFQLDNETVMLAPAAGFYATPGLGLNEVRVAYVLNTEKLKRAIRIIREALRRYTPE